MAASAKWVPIEGQLGYSAAITENGKTETVSFAASNVGATQMAGYAGTDKGRALEGLGRQMYRDQLGMTDAQMDDWKAAARNTESEMRRIVAKLQAEGVYPSGPGMLTPDILVASAVEVGSAISNATAGSRPDGKPIIGMLVDVHGNYNDAGTAFVNSPEKLARASGSTMTPEEVAHYKMDTQLTVMHELGHCAVKELVRNGQPLFQPEGMDSQEAVAFQNFMLSRKHVDPASGEVKQGVGTELSNKMGAILDENFADTYSAINFLRVNDFSPEAVEFLKSKVEHRLEEGTRLREGDVYQNESGGLALKNFADFDSHRMDHAIANVLDNIDEIKGLKPDQILQHAGKMALKAAIMESENHFDDRLTAAFGGEAHSATKVVFKTCLTDAGAAANAVASKLGTPEAAAEAEAFARASEKIVSSMGSVQRFRDAPQEPTASEPAQTPSESAKTAAAPAELQSAALSGFKTISPEEAGPSGPQTKMNGLLVGALPQEAVPSAPAKVAENLAAMRPDEPEVERKSTLSM